MLRRGCLWASCVVLAILPSLLLAQSAPPTGDTYDNSGARNQNYGSQQAFIVQQGANSYIKFSLGTLPSGVTVSKATLRLFVDTVKTNGSFDVYQLNTSWNESTLTYNNAPSLGTSATGGHPVSITSSSQDQFVVIDITPLVQGWANGSIANNGVALALTSSNGAFAFDSKESVLTSHQPELEIALNGPTGPAGPAGPEGPTGPAGPIGPSGPQGQQGQQGPAGQTGATGPQGPIGPLGPMGPQGPQGATGPMGGIGPQGPQGATGPQGPAGTNGTGFNFTGAWSSGSNYNLNDVATYNGSTYVATAANQNQEPDQNPNSWSLMAQEGATGQNGPAGPAGPQGPQGPAGAMGAQGPAGPMGATGAQGPQGQTGATGPAGPAGPQGPQGLPGINGTNGTGFNYRDAFNNNTSYNPYDVVTYDGSPYIAITASNGPNNPPPNQNLSAWNLVTSGLNFTGAWSQSQNYYPDDVVTYNGSTYEATATIAAGGNTPDQNQNWSLLAQQGAAGQAGAQGPSGPAGPQGPQGPQGPPGTLSPGSPYYVQNGTSTQTSTSFNIDGSGTVGGTLAGNTVNATTGYQVGGTTVLSTGTATDQDVFAGAAAGVNNTPGQGKYNAFVGYAAGFSNTTGASNAYLGPDAGSANVAGQGNTMLGAFSALQMSTGSYNVVLGFLAGFNNLGGNSNIYLNTRGGTCPPPAPFCPESNTIRIGSDVDQGEGAQNATYIAGINGQATGGGTPVFIDSTGKLGTAGGTLPNADFSGTYSNTVNLTNTTNTFSGTFNGTSSGSFSGNVNATAGYQIGGNTVLTANPSNQNTLLGFGAGANLFSTGSLNTFIGYQAGINNTQSGSNIYIGNAGCPAPCTEGNTIRIGTVASSGNNRQISAYMAGIYGSVADSNGTPVFVDDNGKLGTTYNNGQPAISTSYYDRTMTVPGLDQATVNATCLVGQMISGSCGFYGESVALAVPVVGYSGPNLSAPTTTWQCSGWNPDTESHTLHYGVICATVYGH